MAPTDKYPNPIIPVKPPAGKTYWPKVYRVGEGPFDPTQKWNISFNGWVYVLPTSPVIQPDSRLIHVMYNSDGTVVVTFFAVGMVDPKTDKTLPGFFLEVSISLESATLQPDHPKGGYVMVDPAAKPPPGVVPTIPKIPGPVDPVDKTGPPQKAPPGGPPGGTIPIPGGGASSDIEAIMKGIIASDGPFFGPDGKKPKPKGPTDVPGTPTEGTIGEVIGEGTPPADGPPDVKGPGAGGGDGNSSFLSKLWTEGKTPEPKLVWIKTRQGLLTEEWTAKYYPAPQATAADFEALLPPKKTPNPADDSRTVTDPISDIMTSRALRIAEATQGRPGRPRSDDPLEGAPWVNTYGADLSVVRIDPVIDPVPISSRGGEVSATPDGGHTSGLRYASIGIGGGPVLALRPDTGSGEGRESESETVKLVARYTDIPGEKVGVPGGGADPAASSGGRVRSS